ncbi:MAG: type III secretion system export apparatus subunit SctV [bacterium]
MTGQFVRRYSDLALAGLVVSIIAMMIVPMPTWLLDILLATNISMAVILLLVSIYVTQPIRIATFPAILLITTLFRLGLNVSSTRLILLQADAGEVIQSFGHFVVAGNIVVGVIVFLILTLIQFVVIAKGSERVAEVAARFTLDAMPGKQMSIDADLRAGTIDQAEARQRRAALERESQLYGSMDGAMKFVKGDAIAGIAITVINIVGGLIVGIYQLNMSASEAVHTYSLLTIGDGLVSQIPALIISTSAGMVITRVASEDNETHLGQEIGAQLLNQPKAIAIAAVLMLLLALVPGLPWFPFLVLGSLCGLAAYGLLRRAARERRARAERGPPGELRALAVAGDRGTRRRGDPGAWVLVRPILVEVSPELTPMLTDAQGRVRLAEAFAPEIRDRLFRALGVPLPEIQVQLETPSLPASGYRILLKEVVLGEGELKSDRVLALATPPFLKGLGIEAEPAELSGLEGRASWAARADVAKARTASVDVALDDEILARHLEALLRRYAYEFVTIQETRGLLDALQASHPQLVEELVPKPVPVPVLAEVLRRLVEEGVNVRHLADILPALAGRVNTEKDAARLADHCRLALRRQITQQFTGDDGSLAAVVLDPEVEQVLLEAIQSGDGGSYLALEPSLSREIVAAARAAVRPAQASGELPVVLASMETRRFVRGLLEAELPGVTVLSYQELAPDLEIRPVARVELGRAGD